MGLDRAAASSDRQQHFAKQMATDFEAWLLRNIVWSMIETDTQLECLCEGRRIASEAGALRERRQGEDVEYLGKIEGIEMALNWLAQERALELVALACAECLADGEQWASNARFNDEHVEAAQAEARQWLQEHTNEAVRVSVLGVLDV
jgi:hypothetical protein